MNGAPDLTITKTDGGASVTPGGVVTYTLNVTNIGNQNAAAVSISETVPANTTFNAGASTAGWVCVPNGNAGSTCTFTIGALAGGGTSDPAVDFALNVDNPIPAGVTQIANSAAVTDPEDPTSPPGTDTTPLTAAPDLSITKVLTTVPPILVNDNVVFALTAINNGLSNATGVVVTDTLPAGLSFVSSDCGASFASPTLTWNVGALAVGTSATCNLTVTVTQTGAIINGASVTGNESDPTPGNNSDVETVSAQHAVVGIPALDGIGPAALMVLLSAIAAFAPGLRRRM